MFDVLDMLVPELEGTSRVQVRYHEVDLVARMNDDALARAEPPKNLGKSTLSPRMRCVSDRVRQSVV
jgi:hypothetical protein